MFSEWGNRGVHLWKVEKQVQALTAGTATYTTPTSTNDVLRLMCPQLQHLAQMLLMSLSKIDRSTYAALPNKGATGQPSQYYVDRQTPTITLYLTPDASTYTLCYYTLNRIEEMQGHTPNNPDIPFRFLPCMISEI